jgi:hypothetical protein
MAGHSVNHEVATAAAESAELVGPKRLTILSDQVQSSFRRPFDPSCFDHSTEDETSIGSHRRLAAGAGSGGPT